MYVPTFFSTRSLRMTFLFQRTNEVTSVYGCVATKCCWGRWTIKHRYRKNRSL